MSRQLKTWEPRRCRVRGDSLSKVAKRQGPAPSRLPETSSWKVLLTGTYWGQETQEGIAETFLELPSRGSCYRKRHSAGTALGPGVWRSSFLGGHPCPFPHTSVCPLSISPTLFFLSVSLSAPLILPGNQNGLKMCASSR